jgi:hypothetical protein
MGHISQTDRCPEPENCPITISMEISGIHSKNTTVKMAIRKAPKIVNKYVVLIYFVIYTLTVN